MAALVATPNVRSTCRSHSLILSFSLSLSLSFFLSLPLSLSLSISLSLSLSLSLPFPLLVLTAPLDSTNFGSPTPDVQRPLVWFLLPFQWLPPTSRVSLFSFSPRPCHLLPFSIAPHSAKPDYQNNCEKKTNKTRKTYKLDRRCLHAPQRPPRGNFTIVAFLLLFLLLEYSHRFRLVSAVRFFFFVHE